MEPIIKRLARLLSDEQASTATEYAMIAALTAIFAIAGLTYMTSEVVEVWTYVATVVSSAIGSG